MFASAAYEHPSEPYFFQAVELLPKFSFFFSWKMLELKDAISMALLHWARGDH